MKLALALRWIGREARHSSGRLLYFTLCLALGVGAVTAVAALVGAVKSAMSAQSRELLGADLCVTAQGPLPQDLERALDLPGESLRVEARELATMLSSPTRSRLVELKAVSAGFPLYGKLAVEPARGLDELLSSEHCLVAEELAAELDLELGARVSIGAASFLVAGVVRSEPGRLDIAFTLGPRVFLNLAGLERTQLELPGSRTRYRAYYRLPRAVSEEDFHELSAALERELPEAPYLRLESAHDGGRTISRALGRVERYLGLVALLSLCLGGVGVAFIVRAWLATRAPAVAVLRTLGLEPREVLGLFLGHVLLLATLASVLGAGLGSLVPFVVERAASELLPEGVVLAWNAASFLRGIVLGIAIAGIFSLLPLTAIWRIPPLRVLRAEVEPLAASRAMRWVASATLGIGLFLAAWHQSGELWLAAYFSAGLWLSAGLLALAAAGVMKCAGRLPRQGWNPYVRHGLAALARPAAGVRGAVVALGLGVLIVHSLSWLETRLAERLRNALPADAPSIFLLDVQPDQWPDVAAQLQEQGASAVRSVPVLTARLSTIDGVAVAELAARAGTRDTRRGRWVLTREQRLTWHAELGPDNTIVAGELWKDPTCHEVSLERNFAEDLGVGLGTKLRFDVQGVSLELTVTSLRQVEWESFGINFFFVVEPGVLESAPHFLLAAARIYGARENSLQDQHAQHYPNLTLIRVRPILEKVLAILARLALGVRVLGLFSLVTGLAILAGVASSAALHRAREVALWQALGLTRFGVVRLLGVEYGAIGLLAGTIGAGASSLLSAGLLTYWLDLPSFPSLLPVALVSLATGLLAAAAGLLASSRALRARPIEVLRTLD